VGPEPTGAKLPGRDHCVRRTRRPDSYLAERLRPVSPVSARASRRTGGAGHVTVRRIRISSNALFIVAGRAWYVGLWVLLTPFVLRQLGSERFGVWSLLFLLSGYLATLDLGLASSVVKFTSEYSSRSDWTGLQTVLSNVLGVSVLLGAAWILGVFLAQNALLDWIRISPGHREEVRFALLASCLLFAFANLANLGPGILNGLQRMDLANGVLVLSSIPQALILWVGLRAGHGLYAVVWSTAAQWAIVGALSPVLVHHVCPQLRFPVIRLRPRGQGWIRFGLVMQANNLIVLMQQQLDKLLLTTWVGLAAVTEFELAFRVANGIQSLPVLALGALMPAFAQRFGEGDRVGAFHLYRRANELVAVSAFGAAAALAPAVPLLIRAWVGPAHPVAEWLGPWLLAGFCLNLLTGAATSASRGAGYPALETTPGLWGIVVHLLMSGILILRLGPRGVGPALALSMAVSTVLCFARFSRWTGQPASRAWLGALVAPAVSFVPATLIGFWLAAHSPWGASETRWGALAQAALVITVAGSFYAATLMIWRRGRRRGQEVGAG